MEFYPLPANVSVKLHLAVDNIIACMFEPGLPEDFFFDMIDAAIEFSAPFFLFPNLGNDDHAMMQKSFSYKHVLGTILLSVDGDELETVYAGLSDFLQVRADARSEVQWLSRVLRYSHAGSAIGTASPELLRRLGELDRRL